MRAWVVVAAVLCGCPGREARVSPADRAVLDEFLTVDAACAQRSSLLEDLVNKRLTYPDEFELRLKQELSEPWKVMREHVEHATLHVPTSLSKPLLRYLDERASSWTELSASLCCDNNGAVHAAEFERKRDVADADRKLIADELAKLRIAEVAAPPPDAGVTLSVPTKQPPGVAYLLVGNRAVALDETGFHDVATEVSTIEAAPDGTLWGCDGWNVVHWDGTKSIHVKPKVYLDRCAVGPDGKLWTMRVERYKTTAQLASFDGKTWTVVTTTKDETWENLDGLEVATDGTIYALEDGGHARTPIFRLVGTRWVEVPLPDGSTSDFVDYITRGNDGQIWTVFQTTAPHDHYPNAVARLTPTGAQKPVYVDDYFRTSSLLVDVDRGGVATILDQRLNFVNREGKRLRLPMQAISAGWPKSAGAFAYDGRGRIWADLLDGLSVIAPDGKRTVYPPGSLDLVREPIKRILVVGAGPELPAPPQPVARDITGTLQGLPHVPVAICVEPGTPDPCGKGLPMWQTETDADGKFSFKGVPRTRLEMLARVGTPGHFEWRSTNAQCCGGDATDLGPVSLTPLPSY